LFPTPQPADHSVATIEVLELLNDVLSLSATDNDNAKSMWLLHQYVQSLAQPGTTRSMREKDFIASKISNLLKRIKFIHANLNSLTFQGNIEKVLYKEMQISENFRAVWWEQMKKHVRKSWMRGSQIVLLL